MTAALAPVASAPRYPALWAVFLLIAWLPALLFLDHWPLSVSGDEGGWSGVGAVYIHPDDWITQVSILPASGRTHQTSAHRHDTDEQTGQNHSDHGHGGNSLSGVSTPLLPLAERWAPMPPDVRLATVPALPALRDLYSDQPPAPPPR